MGKNKKMEKILSLNSFILVYKSRQMHIKSTFKNVYFRRSGKFSWAAVLKKVNVK